MGTLVTEPYLAVMPDFFGMSRDEFLTDKHPTSWIEFEEGKISEDEYVERFFKDGRSIDGVGLRDRMKEAYNWIDGMKSLVAELYDAGYDMHALSNYSTWFNMIEDKLNVSRYVQWSFVSCHTGIRKPAPQAYLGAAKALDAAPAECLFIDDRQGNVDAAREVGMLAIVFENSWQLRRELQRRALL